MMNYPRKYIWLRNIALLSICAFLCFSLFPVPPITWRLLFLGIAIVAIWPNINSLTRLEKSVMTFWGLNLIYYFISYLWLDNPNTSQIGNISVTLFAVPLFMTLSRKGVMTERFYIVAIILLLLCSVIYYETMRLRAIEQFFKREYVTVNASVVFLYILPLILIIKNRYLSYITVLICSYFLMDAAKRGNIVCAIPVIVLFVILTFRNKQVKVYEKIIFIIFFIIAISWGVKQYSENEYLQLRVEQTLEGNSSGRDKIYENSWRVYSESQNIKNIIFGYGFQGTINHDQLGGKYAHNDWLEILVDYGAIGFVCYLLIFIHLFRLLKKTKELQKRYVLIAICSVWFLRTVFSMGFTSDTMFILFLSFGNIYHKELNPI